jgi:hypothetical protein
MSAWNLMTGERVLGYPKIWHCSDILADVLLAMSFKLPFRGVSD